MITNDHTYYTEYIPETRQEARELHQTFGIKPARGLSVAKEWDEITEPMPWEPQGPVLVVARRLGLK